MQNYMYDETEVKEQPTSIPRSCTTCEHRIKDLWGREFDKCRKTGDFILVTMKYDDVARGDDFHACGNDFRGWTPRLGFKDRAILWFKGAK